MTLKRIKEGTIVLNKITKEKMTIVSVKEGAVVATDEAGNSIEITNENAICFSFISAPESPTGYKLTDEGKIVSPLGAEVKLGEIKPVRAVCDTNNGFFFLASNGESDGYERLSLFRYIPEKDVFVKAAENLSAESKPVRLDGSTILASDCYRKVMVPAKEEGAPEEEKIVFAGGMIILISDTGHVDTRATRQPIGDLMSVVSTIVEDWEDPGEISDLIFQSGIDIRSGYAEERKGNVNTTVFRISRYLPSEERPEIGTWRPEPITTLETSGELIESLKYDAEEEPGLLIRTSKELIYVGNNIDNCMAGIVIDGENLSKIPDTYKYAVAAEIVNPEEFRLTVATEDYDVLMIKSSRTPDRGMVVTVEAPGK